MSTNALGTHGPIVCQVVLAFFLIVASFFALYDSTLAPASLAFPFLSLVAAIVYYLSQSQTRKLSFVTADMLSIQSEAVILTERLNLACSVAGVGIWEWLIESNQLVWNDTMYQLYGITADQFAGVYEAWSQSVHPDDLHAAAEHLNFAITNEKNFDTVFRIVCPNKTIKYIKAFGTVKRDAEGRAISMLGVNIDISAEVAAEQQIAEVAAKLQENNYFLDSVFENMPSMVFIKDAAELRFRTLNRAGEELLGYSRQEFIGKNDYDFFPPDQAEVFTANDREALSKNGVTDIPEEQIQTKNLGLRWLHTKKVKIPGPDGKPAYLLGVSEDITDDKRAIIERAGHLAELEAKTRALQAALAEKEVLLKEIHHRVKNNMQVISSLLKLQSQYIDDPVSRSLFRQSDDRVRSMALIHERLYRSEGLADIDLAAYIDELSSTLVRSYSISSKNVRVETALEKVVLGIDQAVPCGLLLNEFISNALKHAFDPNVGGQINISLTLDNRHVTLTIADNGCGLPADFDISIRKSLGMEIIYTLTEQLAGTLKIEREKGSKFILEFELLESESEKQLRSSSASELHRYNL